MKKPTIEQVAWIFDKISEQMEEGGTFRKLIYDRMGFDDSAYTPLYIAGGMSITNMICDFNEKKTREEIMTLRKEYEKLVNKYLDKLLEGTKYKLDFWVADIIGGVAAINFDVYIGFDEIMFCVDNNISIEKFYDYQEWAVEEHFKKPISEQYKDYVAEKYLTSSIMNFKNWLKMYNI